MRILKWDSDDLPTCLKNCNEQFLVSHWYRAVSKHFRDNCPTGKRLRFVKFYNDCFTGSEAITWLQEELRTDMFKAILTRAQTQRVLRILQKLDKMFVDVRGKKYEHEDIVDDRTLYRFCDYVPFCEKLRCSSDVNCSSVLLGIDSVNFDVDGNALMQPESLMSEKTEGFQGEQFSEDFSLRQRKSTSAFTNETSRNKGVESTNGQKLSKLKRTFSLSKISFPTVGDRLAGVGFPQQNSDHTLVTRTAKLSQSSTATERGQFVNVKKRSCGKLSFKLNLLLQEPEHEPEEMTSSRDDNTYRLLIIHGFKRRMERILTVRNLEDFVDISLIEPEVLYENLSMEKRDRVVSERDDYPNWVLEAMYSMANWPRVKVSDNPKAQVIGITVMENYLKKMAPLLTHRLHDLFSRVMGLFIGANLADKENRTQSFSSFCSCSCDRKENREQLQLPVCGVSSVGNLGRQLEPDSGFSLFKSMASNCTRDFSGGQLEMAPLFPSECLTNALQVLVKKPGLTPSCVITKDSFGKNIIRLSKPKSSISPDFYSLMSGVAESRLVEALQLCCLLLTDSQRERLRIFLEFVRRVIANADVEMEGDGCKCLYFVHKFSKSLLAGPVVSNYNSQIGACLFVFMTRNHAAILKKPNKFEIIVDACCNAKDEDNTFSQQNSAFCSQITVNEYESQRTEGTDAELKKLLEDISGNKQISSRVKQEQLKRFEKLYPEIYYDMFPPTAVPIRRGQFIRRSFGALRKFRI